MLNQRTGRKYFSLITFFHENEPTLVEIHDYMYENLRGRGFTPREIKALAGLAANYGPWRLHGIQVGNVQLLAVEFGKPGPEALTPALVEYGVELHEILSARDS